MNKENKTSALDAMLAQYEDSKTAPASTGNSTKKTYELKNYFNTFIKEGLKSGSKTVRVLPTKDGSSPFVVMFGHKIEVEGEDKTFACLKEEKGTPCPFCEARAALLATGRDSDKELAKKYGNRKMYVVKVIERGNEEEGVKFWRFNHNYKQQGIFDKIGGIISAIKKDITDVETGRDLIININREEKTGYLQVSSIVSSDPSKLSEDTALLKEWTSDARTWEDVYAVKSYDFLEIIVKGGAPRWDKDAKKFVDKDSLKTTEGENLHTELTLGIENVKANVKAATKTSESVSSTVESDDLPF